MYITPVIPESGGQKLNNDIIKKAENVVIESAKLTGGHNKYFIDAIKELLRITNSYYSNRIESEGTHPVDIEKAMRKEFSEDSRKQDLQKLSLIHIEIQKQFENRAVNAKEENKKLFNYSTIKEIHKEFYSKKDMAHALKIKHENLEQIMIPGELRECHVEIGEHVALSPDVLNSSLSEFETLYNQCKPLSQTMKLIYVLCSHHRLVYIHPFIDGNGRISRLYLDYLFQKINLEGYGLWNLSRGLARDKENYFNSLAEADLSFNGGYDDGRGVLSLKGLNSFLNFMLDTAIDQIRYMSSVIRIDQIATRMNNYVEFAAKGMYFNVDPLPKGSEKIFQKLLINGEIFKNSIKDLLGVSKPTAIKVTKELESRGYIYSNGPKEPIRIKFNSHFASEIMPELFPKA